jgi:Flp pilus assembly protein TadG
MMRGRIFAKPLSDFAGDCSGATALIFGLVLPVLMGVTGMAVDYGLLLDTRSKAQTAADTAAIASARELQLANVDTAKVTNLANNYVHARMPAATVQTNVDVKAGTVQVSVATDFAPKITGSLWSGTRVQASATARISGGTPLCLLGLDKSASGTIYLERQARVTATGCSAYSNSTHARGITSGDDAVLQAALICSAGGVAKTKATNITPQPLTDCPPLPDPLSARQTPSTAGCNFTNIYINGTVRLLQPGVYCGGLRVLNGARAILAPGIYVIKDGALRVDNNSSFIGVDVGIFLKGSANLTFGRTSTISLSAPKTGVMAGLLIYDDPSGAAAPANPPAPSAPGEGSAMRVHKILSDNARTLLGTIYMPQGRLVVDARRPIADRSAYTVIVVKQIDLHNGPNLVLNSDYSASDVPVPEGVGPYGSKVSLTD